MVFVFEFKFLDSNKNHEKYNLTFQNMLSLKMIFQTSYILWPPIQNYFCCPCHGCIFIYLSSNNVQIIFFMSFILVRNSKSEFKLMNRKSTILAGNKTYGIGSFLDSMWSELDCWTMLQDCDIDDPGLD